MNRHFQSAQNKFLLFIAVFTIIPQCLIYAAPRIDRIDLYDIADNHLLFVTFDYDAGGKNTGRTVFASDSTFLRHTTFQTNTSGDIVRENSIDFDSNTAYYTTLNTSAGKTTFSVFDQFGLDQLGGPVSCTTGSQIAFDLSQNGAALNRITYDTASDGSLTRINVLDKTGAMLYYATVSSASAVLRGVGGHIPVRPVITLIKNGQCNIVFEVTNKSQVSLEMFTVSGKAAGKLVSKQFTAGAYSFRVPLGKTRPAAGIYLFRLSINGQTAAVTRGMVERQGVLP
jgi:hypothetical protein